MAANPITSAPRPEQSFPVTDPVVRSVRVQPGPSDASAEPPWPEFPSHQKVPWERFMSFPGAMEAHIVAGRLNAEGVPTLVLSAPGFETLFTAEILVPKALLHRARWVLSWPPASEEELLFLATGEIAPSDGQTPP
jgi:hypothetical protein